MVQPSVGPLVHPLVIGSEHGNTSQHHRRSQAGGRTMGPGPVVPMKVARQVVGPMVRFNADHEIATGSWIGPGVGPWAGQEVGDGPILGPWAGPSSLRGRHMAAYGPTRGRHFFCFLIGRRQAAYGRIRCRTRHMVRPMGLINGPRVGNPGA